ncbi:hypothetical protein ABFS83_12G161200 [Erythranthe nasuta]
MVSFRHRNHLKMLPLSTLLKIGFTPTLKDFNNLFLLLSRNQKFKAIIHVFSQLSSNRINADAQTRTIFAKAMIKESRYEEAADFLRTHEIFHQNRVFDSLIQALCTCNQDPERGLSLLKDSLKLNGVVPSSRTFCLLICCFSKMGKMDRVIDLLELMSDDKFKYPFDNYVCSSVISGFSRIGEPELAVGFYETAVKSGSLMPNSVTCTAILTAYCKLRNVEKVSELVAWMGKNDLAFDVVFYSNWAYGCLREGLVHEAFKIVRAMVDKKVELDTISYTILIDWFSKNGNVEKAVGFLHKMRRDGIEPNLVTYTAIILGFCSKGKLDEAFSIFGMLEKLGIEADEFAYAILINGVCRKGDFDLVYQLLDEMPKRGISPGVVTYNTVINGLCKVGRTSEADDFSKGIIGDAFTYSTLLQGYVKEHNNSGILETKTRLESAGVRMDVVVCNVLIKAMFMVGLFEDAFAIYKGLQKMDISANSITYFTLIDGYCKAGRIDEALVIFDEYRNMPDSSPACYECIILGLCEKGMADMACDVLIEYIKKGLPLDKKLYMMLIEAAFNVKGAESVLEVMYRIEETGFLTLPVLCTDAVYFLCKLGFPEASYDILSAMRNEGLEWASLCYYSILGSLLFEGKKLLARLILSPFVKIYGMSDLRVCEIVLNYLCLHDVKKSLVFLSSMNEKNRNITIPVAVFKTLINEGRVLDAYELLVGAKDNLAPMDVVSYTIIIDALCKKRRIKEALDICSLAAKKKGIALSIVTFNSVINGLCHQGCLTEAFRLFDSLERIDILPTEVTYGTLIDALAKEGLLHDANMLLESMLLKNLEPNTRIYNSLINGYCKSGLLDEAIKIFHDLEMRNLKPDGFTVGALINGYCLKGDMEGALNLYLEFKRNGFLPDFLGFMYLVRGLCAKGRMGESWGILREMLQTPSVVDLLGRVDSGAESDSVENLLVFLLDRGSIYEAVALLNKVGAMVFSAGRNSSLRTLDPHTEVTPSINNGIGFHSVLYDDVEKEGNDMVEICGGEDGKTEQLKDFDSFYSRIRSLCSKGDLAKANRLTKLLMEL